MNDEASQAEPNISEPDVSKEEKTFGMLCHLTAILTGFLGPLIIWLVKKDESQYVDYHGREALNFAITATIAFVGLMIGVVVVSFVLAFIPIINLLVPLLMLLPFALYVGIVILLVIAGIKANEGIKYSYPFCLRLIK